MVELKSRIDAPERSPAVILCAEMRGFTRMSEMLDPGVVLMQVSRFFELVTAAVDKKEGLIASLLNDTVVAIFTGQDDARNAVEAAQEIQREFAAFHDALERDCGMHTAVAIGLPCGDVVAGYVDGPNVDQLLIVGDCVSVTQRLMHRARAGEYLLSQILMDLLAETGFALDAEELPKMEIRNREPVRIFGVVLDTRLDFTQT
jgi:class 3 adenylate cyclase